MTKGNTSCFNQVGTSFCLNSIAINRNIIELVTQDEKPRTPPSRTMILLCISKNHPRDVFLIGKFNNEPSRSDFVERLNNRPSLQLCIGISFQWLIESNISDSASKVLLVYLIQVIFSYSFYKIDSIIYRFSDFFSMIWWAFYSYKLKRG